MTTNYTYPSDVADVKIWLSQVADGVLRNSSRCLSSGFAVDRTAGSTIGSGGKSASWTTFERAVSGDGVDTFSESAAIDVRGAALVETNVAFTRGSYPLGLNQFALEECIKAGNYDLVDQIIMELGGSFAEWADKYIVAVAKAAATAASHDTVAADTALNTTFLNAKYGTFGDNPDAVEVLICNTNLAKKIVSANLTASNFGVALAPNGTLSRYLGMDVLVSDNLGTATKTIASVSTTCDCAILGVRGAVEVVAPPMSLRVIQERNGNDVYDAYMKIAGNAPVKRGIVPVSAVYIGQ